jgi:hypothetical protein
MTKQAKHNWVFKARFRRGAFGWRSQPAIKRIKEAVSEIKKVARKEPVVGGEGAVLLLTKVAPAIEAVDSSSGAIGSAVNSAIQDLVPIIAKAQVDQKARDQWLESLWQAIQDDDMPYIELLPEYWGELCVTAECASKWADSLITGVRLAWSPDPDLRGYFKGTPACLSALLRAGRHAEIMELLKLAPFSWWSDRKWGVKALLAMGKKAEALRFAEESVGLNDPVSQIHATCEEILLNSGLADEAYKRYSVSANQKITYLATFRAIAKKYPSKAPEAILQDLVASTPGSEGKWFAAAKSAGFYNVAIELANRTPCDHKVLIRAARDMAETQPQFAREAGMTALRWLVDGYGYEITALDVRDAYTYTMQAAEKTGCKAELFERIRKLVAGESVGDQFVTKVLGKQLGLS